MKTHINRRHTGTGRPIPKIATDPLWTGGVEYKTGFKNNNFSITNHNSKATDIGDFLEQILQRLRKQKEFKDLYSELYRQQFEHHKSSTCSEYGLDDFGISSHLMALL